MNECGKRSSWDGVKWINLDPIVEWKAYDGLFEPPKKKTQANPLAWSHIRVAWFRGVCHSSIHVATGELSKLIQRTSRKIEESTFFFWSFDQTWSTERHADICNWFRAVRKGLYPLELESIIWSRSLLVITWTISKFSKKKEEICRHGRLLAWLFNYVFEGMEKRGFCLAPSGIKPEDGLLSFIQISHQVTWKCILPARNFRGNIPFGRRIPEKKSPKNRWPRKGYITWLVNRIRKLNIRNSRPGQQNQPRLTSYKRLDLRSDVFASKLR